MVGFGIPINEFSLGNTLIIAGTTALAGGLVVVALAIATRYLRRISDQLSASATRAPRVTESADLPSAGGGTPPGPPPRMPFPPRPRQEQQYDPRGELPYRDQGGHDPRFAGAPEAPQDPIFERLRMERPGGHRNGAETALITDEDAPLSPRRIPVPTLAQAEPALDAPGLRDLRGPRAPSDKGRNGSAVEPAPQAPAFDDAWPAEPRAKPSNSSSRDTAPSTRMNGDASHHDTAHNSARGHENAPVSILKSGVVDGMAYTLYTDGSIEAELAQGVVRFGSIEELRNHLEKNA
jgi:hypothetical protein